MESTSYGWTRFRAGSSTRRSWTTFCCSTTILLVLVFVVGFLAGYFGKTSSKVDDSLWAALTGSDLDPTISKRLMDEIQPDNIQEHHRYMTSFPHLAGTHGERKLAEYIADTWRQQGLASVRLVPYRVLMSYPDLADPSRVVIYDVRDNTTVFMSQLREKVLRPDDNQTGVVPPYNVYAPSGIVTGRLVYVNYGRLEDFQWLQNNAVDVSGTICIARYGRLFRADKVALGERFGCIGMILYTDPSDYALEGVADVYPDSWWMPGTGVQRGTIKKSASGIGDPLTPYYPSVESAFRLNVSEADLPKIPVHPIGYDDAKVLLESIGGERAPDDWQGSLNITYRIGPDAQHTHWKVELRVSTNRTVVTTQNVVAFIEGSVEPDRYVIVGNHYDSFSLGSLDPNSGAAVMLELSRAFAKLHGQGWRPRRTLVFCAWGAEELGLVGSTEWVENFDHILSDRTVAYLNVDIAVQGKFVLRARALPMLHNVLYDAAKAVDNPDDDEVRRGRRTVYDTWLARSTSPVDKQTPHIPLLGSGSDYAAFVCRLGVSSVDFRFTFDRSLNISSYPVYHSIYETSYYYETLIDPGFKFSAALGRVWGEVARRLLEPALLPFACVTYATAIKGYAEQLETSYGQMMRQHGLSTQLDYLQKAVNNLVQAAKTFEQRLRNFKTANPLQMRQLNDQMMQFERAFIDPRGLPNRSNIRHVVFAPSVYDSYAGSTFPGVVDGLFELQQLSGGDSEAAWRNVEQQLSVVTFLVDSAAASLAPPSEF